MHVRKYHGNGNDFLILVDPDGTQPVDGELARAVCDRHRGVGADGFIRVTADPGPGLRGPNGAIRMELYNADGGRAEISGNGLRCVARAVVDVGLTDECAFTVLTDAGPRPVELLDDGLVSVEMGLPKIDGQDVDLGNPHRVVFAEGAIEPPEEPDVNVEFVWPGPGRDEITVRVWERGVGETLACGSGAVAAAAVAHEKGLVGERITVHQPGGDVVVELAGGAATLIGPVTFVCEVEYPWP